MEEEILPCRNRVVRPGIEATDASSDISLNWQTVNDISGRFDEKNRVSVSEMFTREKDDEHSPCCLRRREREKRSLQFQ